jgi:hypothetical protein
MEPIVVAFGTALVAAMATDAWQQAREAVVALWRSVHTPKQADTIDADLDRLREQILAARSEDAASTEPAHAAVWRGRLQELLLDNPALAGEMRQILDEVLLPMLPPEQLARVGQAIMIGSSHDASTFNQVAGNQINIQS